jgi:hypothetical protein
MARKYTSEEDLRELAELKEHCTELRNIRVQELTNGFKFTCKRTWYNVRPPIYEQYSEEFEGVAATRAALFTAVENFFTNGEF